MIPKHPTNTGIDYNSGLAFVWEEVNKRQKETHRIIECVWNFPNPTNTELLLLDISCNFYESIEILKRAITGEGTHSGNYRIKSGLEILRKEQYNEKRRIKRRKEREKRNAK